MDFARFPPRRKRACIGFNDPQRGSIFVEEQAPDANLRAAIQAAQDAFWEALKSEDSKAQEGHAPVGIARLEDDRTR
jgi:hypothetical protein